ncbi:MAG: HPP family protein [Tepidiformaceae bacterium]
MTGAHPSRPAASRLARLRDFLHRYQYLPLTERYHPQLLLATFTFVNSFVSIALISTIAVIFNGPFIFPSAGATAFLLFFSPLSPAASPRNTIYGHAIGAASGWLALLAFGLRDAPPPLPDGMTWQHVFAAALSLGVAGAVMVLLRTPHPPGGATALIVSLGLLSNLDQIAVLVLAIAVLCAQAIVINRMAGFPYPFWHTKEVQLPPVRST